MPVQTISSFEPDRVPDGGALAQTASGSRLLASAISSDEAPKACHWTSQAASSSSSVSTRRAVKPGRIAGGSPREDEGDRVGILVGPQAALEQRVDEPGGADEPTSHCVCVRPRSRRWARTSSSTSSTSSSGKRCRWTVFQVEPGPRQSV